MSKKGKLTWFSKRSPIEKVNFKCHECQRIFEKRDEIHSHYLSVHSALDIPKEDDVKRIWIGQQSQSAPIMLTLIDTRVPNHQIRHVSVDYENSQVLHLVFQEISQTCSENLQTLILNCMDTLSDNSEKLHEHFQQISSQVKDLKMLHADLQNVNPMIGYCRSVESLSVLNAAEDIPREKLKWMQTPLRLLRTFIFFDKQQLDINFGIFLSANPHIKNVFTNNIAAIKSIITTNNNAMRFVVARIERETEFWDMVKCLLECKHIQSMDLSLKCSVTESTFRVISIMGYVEGIHLVINEKMLESIDNMSAQLNIKRLCLKGTIDEEMGVKFAKLFPNIEELHIRQYPNDVDCIKPFLLQTKIRDIYCNRDVNEIGHKALNELNEIRKGMPNASRVIIHTSDVPDDHMIVERDMILIDYKSSVCCLICQIYYLPNEFPGINNYLLNMKSD